MFTVALLTTVKMWKKPEFSSVDELTKKLWCVCIYIYINIYRVCIYIYISLYAKVKCQRKINIK